MEVRKAVIEDLERIMELYAGARAFMAAHGNPHQWGDTNWPPEELIREDIAFFRHGVDIDPCYRRIEQGAWLEDSPYGVVHRIAADSTVRGAGTFCIQWAFAQCGHLRMDTHGDNTVMQNLLKKLGFRYCGIIHVEEDDDPRLAFEKIKAD